jgi:hypothetical protein
MHPSLFRVLGITSLSVMVLVMFVVPDVFARGGGGRSGGYRGGSHSSGGHVGVRPHIRRDGTYVQPHYRTAPNSTQRDNFSRKPNVNPYTGKPGTREPER